LEKSCAILNLGYLIGEHGYDPKPEDFAAIGEASIDGNKTQKAVVFYRRAAMLSSNELHDENASKILNYALKKLDSEDKKTFFKDTIIPKLLEIDVNTLSGEMLSYLRTSENKKRIVDVLKDNKELFNDRIHTVFSDRQVENALYQIINYRRHGKWTGKKKIAELNMTNSCQEIFKIFGIKKEENKKPKTEFHFYSTKSIEEATEKNNTKDEMIFKL